MDKTRKVYLLILLSIVSLQSLIIAANSTQNFTNASTVFIYPGECTTINYTGTNETMTLCGLFESFNLTYFVNSSLSYVNPIINLSVVSTEPPQYKYNLSISLGNGSIWQDNQSAINFSGNGSVYYQNITIQNVTQVTVINTTNTTTVQNITVVTQVINVTARYQYNITRDPFEYDEVLNISDARIFIRGPTKKSGIRDVVNCPENYTNPEWDVKLEIRNTSKVCESYTELAKTVPGCTYAVNVPICVDEVSEGDLKLFLRGNASAIKDEKVKQILASFYSTDAAKNSTEKTLEAVRDENTGYKEKLKNFDLLAELRKVDTMYLFGAMAVFIAMLLIGIVWVYRQAQGHTIGRGGRLSSGEIPKDDLRAHLQDRDPKEILRGK